MHIYEINGHEVPLFPMRYVQKLFNMTRGGINSKMYRQQIPPANYIGNNGHRLFSIEDLSVLDYVYKEVWPYKQGVKTPDWVKELLAEAFDISKKIVFLYGKSIEIDDWKELDNKYAAFSRYRLQLYVESWRRRLLDVDKFFPELCDSDNDL